MRDEDDGQSKLTPEGLQQLQDLCLDHHVEGGRGLVADDQPGSAGECHRDHDPLAHAAAELVGIVPPSLGVDAHHLEQLTDTRPRRVAAHARLVLGDRFQDLVPDPTNGVEGVHGALEDDAHLGPAPLPEGIGAESRELLAREPDGAAGQPSVLGQQAHDGQRGRGLATAGLADEADRLTRRPRRS